MKSVWLKIVVCVAATLSITCPAQAQIYRNHERLSDRMWGGSVPHPGMRGPARQAAFSESFLDGKESADTGCGACGAEACCGDCGRTGLLAQLFENASAFTVYDAWANHGDDDDNNNFGLRVGSNTSVGVGNRIRVQLGSSYAVYDLFGREDPVTEALERQLFVTGGLFKRSQIACGDRISWGVVYDYLDAENWGEETDNISLSQLRYRFGLAINECHEVGLWGTWSLMPDRTTNLGNGVRVRARRQMHLFAQQNWDFGANTMLYGGLADGPIGVLGNEDAPNLSELVVGMRGHAPLNCNTALFANVHWILPGTSPGDQNNNGTDNSYAEQAWNISFGIVVYPGGRAVAETVSGWATMPLMPVADNGTFSVNTPAGGL